MLNRKPDTASELADKFRDWMKEIPWLQPTKDLLASLVEPPEQIDLAVEVTVPGGATVVLLVEMKERLRPSEVSTVASQLSSYSERPGASETLRMRTGIRRSEAQIVPLVAARWLSPRTQEELRRVGLGWFDLAGNAHIEFPGVYLHVEGIKNPFQSETRAMSWKSDHTQRVLRVLLAPDRLDHHWRQREIEDACEPTVSLGTVNKVAKGLVEEAYAVETEEGLRLRDPCGLLKRWAQDYVPPYRRTRKFYTILHSDALLERIRDFCANRENRIPSMRTDFALAGLSAAKYFAPYVRDPTLYCYGTPMAAEQLIQRLELKEDPDGANVIFWETARPDAFLMAEKVSEDVYATDLVQTYLDLSVGGERSKEAAEFLFDHKLKEIWQGGAL